MRGARFSSSNRFKQSFTTTPGPGKYENISNLKDQKASRDYPKFSFSTSEKMRFKPLSDSPSPNKQTIGTTVVIKPLTIPKDSSSQFANSMDDNPGPGQYTSLEKIYQDNKQPKGANQSMTGRKFQERHDQIPGPGRYTINNYKQSGYSIGKESKLRPEKVLSNSLIVGPGDYNQDKSNEIKRASPKYTFGDNKTSIKNLMKKEVNDQGFIVPGPGAQKPVEKFGKQEGQETYFFMNRKKPAVKKFVSKKITTINEDETNDVFSEIISNNEA